MTFFLFAVLLFFFTKVASSEGVVPYFSPEDEEV